MNTSVSFSELKFLTDTEGKIVGGVIPTTATYQGDSYYTASGSFSLTLEDFAAIGLDLDKLKKMMSKKVAENLSAMATDLTGTTEQTAS